MNPYEPEKLEAARESFQERTPLTKTVGSQTGRQLKRVKKLARGFLPDHLSGLARVEEVGSIEEICNDI